MKKEKPLKETAPPAPNPFQYGRSTRNNALIVIGAVVILLVLGVAYYFTQQQTPQTSNDASNQSVQGSAMCCFIDTNWSCVPTNDVNSCTQGSLPCNAPLCGPIGAP